MAEWRTASTRVATQDSHSTRPGGRISTPPRHQPAGDLHAYVPGEETTACGVPVASLRLWPTRPFLRGHSPDRCRSCQERVTA